MYTIGETAKTLGISPHTLRYYEKENIISPDRDEQGDRRYRDSHIQWLKFVIKLKETQMPIVRIKQYAALFLEGEQTTLDRLKILEEHKQSIQDQIQTLQSADEMLERKISAYKDFIKANNKQAL